MSEPPRLTRGRSSGAWWRAGATATSIVAVQTLVCGLAALPVVLAWSVLAEWVEPTGGLRPVVFAILLAPSYVVFGLDLIVVSAAVTWVARLRTPPDTEMRIAAMEWRLMRWAHYMAAIRVVRALAGGLFRGSPVWTLYLRLNGAHVGRRVYVNSLELSDHNLLELGDDVVIGADAHLAGHTVEAGVVKTAGVRLGKGATVGLGAVVGIGVVVGPGCQVGALSVVPKHTTLEGDATYAGIPVHRIR